MKLKGDAIRRIVKVMDRSRRRNEKPLFDKSGLEGHLWVSFINGHAGIRLRAECGEERWSAELGYAGSLKVKSEEIPIQYSRAIEATQWIPHRTSVEIGAMVQEGENISGFYVDPCWMERPARTICHKAGGVVRPLLEPVEPDHRTIARLHVDDLACLLRPLYCAHRDKDAGPESTRYLHLYLEDKGLTAVATDGKRLAEVVRPIYSHDFGMVEKRQPREVSPGVFVPNPVRMPVVLAREVLSLITLWGDKSDVWITHGPEHSSHEEFGLTIKARYPLGQRITVRWKVPTSVRLLNYDVVMQRQTPPTFARTFDGMQFCIVAKTAAKMAAGKKSRIVLAMAPIYGGSLLTFQSPRSGEGNSVEAAVQCSANSDDQGSGPWSLTMDAKYIFQMAENLRGNRVTLEAFGQNNALRIQEECATHLIMPIRDRDE